MQYTSKTNAQTLQQLQGQALPYVNERLLQREPVPALKLNYNTVTKLFEAVWQRPVANQEYRQLVRYTSLCIAILRPEHILFDFTELGVPSAEVQKSTTEFLKQALQNITFKRSAQVLATNNAQLHAHRHITQDSAKLLPDIQVFGSYTEAKAWLTASITAECTGNDIPIPLHSSLKALRKISAATPKTAPEVQQPEPPKETRCTTDFMEITVKPQQSLICLRWTRKVTSRELRYGVLKACRALIDHESKLGLVNNQLMGVLTLQDLTWVAQKFSELLSRSKLQYLAVVSSPDVMQQLASDTLNARIRQYYNAHISEYFLSETEALDWLTISSSQN